MKKALSLILAVMMLLGTLSITAFAKGKTGKSDTTDITLTVAKSLTYDMVIPEDVTNLNAAGIYSVGQAKVANVKNATDKTVISYTATTTAFKSEGKNDIPASYYTDSEGKTAFPTTAVEVYKNGGDAENIPTMYVGISESDWNAAENGTYTATVTFNFEAKEVTPVTAADALVTDAQFNVTIQNPNQTTTYYTYQRTTDGFTLVSVMHNNSDVTSLYTSNYPATLIETNIIEQGEAGYHNLKIHTNNNTYEFTDLSGRGFIYVGFSVKPAGATEFTEVTLTAAVPG